jgi:hypothetical protein
MTSIQPATVPSAAVLSTWHSHRWDNGINLSQLAALDRVLVRTRNSLYEIIVSSPASGDVLVRGGEFFPEFTSARVAGATLGGSFLKLRSIHVGFRLEFTLGQNFVLTSPVETIDVATDVSVSG